MNLEKIKQEAEKYQGSKDGTYNQHYKSKGFTAGAIFGVNATVEAIIDLIDMQQIGSPIRLKDKINSLKINP